MEKFEVDLEVIKCKIHDENLSEDFINDLEEKLNNEYNKSSNVDNNINTDIKKNNVVKFPFHFCKTAVAVFACFLVFSTYTFADEIEDIIKAMFCSVSPTSETAYDDGKLIEVDSEYQKFGEISAKVDYVSVHENDICIAINVKSDSEYDDINVKEMNIKDEFKNLIYDNKRDILDRDYIFVSDKKILSKNNCIILFEISHNEINFFEWDSIEVNIENIITNDNNNTKENIGIWNFTIDLFNKKG